MTQSDLAPPQAVSSAQYLWRWRQQAYSITYQSWGAGPTAAAGAFSKVSSRSEFDSVGQILAAQYRVTSLDWLGLGQADRPRLD
jgi:hypothetical protein